MTHISSIGAGMFSDLSMCVGSSLVPATYDTTGFAALFTALDATPLASAVAGGFVRIPDVREFPAMGTPPNIVKVPVYGQAQSQTIQGQADAPQLELTLNYVPSLWDRTSGLGAFVGDNIKRAFRFTLLNSDPTTSATWVAGAATNWASSSVGFGGRENTIYYWVGKMEALLVKPSLTDATTATLTMSIQSDFYGAFTYS